MLNSFIEQITFIKLLVFSTFIFGLIFLRKNNRFYLPLIIIISLSFLNELLSSLRIIQGLPLGLNMSLYALVNCLIWIFLNLNAFETKYKFIFIALFLIFSLINLFFFQGIDKFNTQTFVFGSLIYFLLFLKGILNKIKMEDLLFFKSNVFVLITAPMLFFLCFSLIISFNNVLLMKYQLFGIKLYVIISYFVNIIYYSLINIYIYRERKLKNA